MEIGIFLIATDKYIDFVAPLYEDICKFFLPGHVKFVYVFTDSPSVPNGTIKVKQKHKPWPYPTLYRYHIILNYCATNTIRHDYYYYLDVDMRIVDFVGDEILGGTVATIHPGFYNKPKIEFPHSNVFLSHAYTPYHKVMSYYAGAVNGGSEYLKMASVIKKWVDNDSEYGFVPEWHDESYLNKYLALNPPDIALDPSYCYPDNAMHAIDWGINKLSPKIICLYKKNKYTESRDTIQEVR